MTIHWDQLDRAGQGGGVWDIWAFTRALGDSAINMVVVERPGEEQVLVLTIIMEQQGKSWRW